MMRSMVGSLASGDCLAGHHAADGGGASGSEIQRESQAHLVGFFLDRLHGDAGLDGDGLVVAVTCTNAGHARQVQDDLLT